MTTKIVVMSDTHGYHKDLVVPEGDILIHAGDVTSEGSFESFANFLRWLKGQPHKHKCFIGGNHDEVLDKHFSLVDGMIKESGCIYLENDSCSVEGLKMWGSPITPRFGHWFFMEDRDKIGKYWEKIPEHLDVLVTHGPPYGILDFVHRTYGDHNVGCEALLKKVKEVKPRFQIFGHIHGSYGKKKVGKTTYVNASSCNESYDIVNEPVVIDL